MSDEKLLPRMIGLTCLMLLVACSTPKPVSTAELIAPAPTSEPTPAEIEPQTVESAVAEDGDGPLGLVVLGDSLVAEGMSVLPELYAQHMERYLCVEVEIHNLAIGGETTDSLLKNVQKYPWYREPTQEAEVILISVGGGNFVRKELRYFGGECGGDDNQDCLREERTRAQRDWDALLAEISSLPSPTDTLIRPIIPTLLGQYDRVYQDRPAEVDAYYSYLVDLYTHMAQSSERLGIPVLNLYQLYDAPGAEPGLPEIAGIGDGVHVSDEGNAVIADLLRGLGYEYARP